MVRSLGRWGVPQDEGSEIDGAGMTQDQDFRHLARKVRQTARAQLQEIRAARLGNAEAAGRRRKAAVQVEVWDGLVAEGLADMPAVPALVEACPVEILVPEQGAAEFFGPPLPSADAGLVDEGSVEGLEFFEPPRPEPEFFGPYLVAQVQVLEPEQDVAEVADEPLASLILTNPAQRALEQVAPPVPQPLGDLALLPGAGPGLIWMLNKCGIFCLEDMACADAATLTPKLGLVGQIVNVPAWLRFAQRHVRKSA